MFTGTITGRTQETPSDICLPDLPHTRPDHPQVRPNFFPASALDRALEQLAGLHLRITLCHLSLAAVWSNRLAACKALQDPSLMVSDLDDGGLLILYVGPRRWGAEGDLDAERVIGEKLRRGLDESRVVDQSGDMLVSMAHCWSDAMDLRHGMGDPLALVTPEPLEDNKRAAA